MKKGFTLVELLAVIIILAVIATIVVPIALRAINTSKEGSVIRSGENYLTAISEAILNKNIETMEEFDPKVCEVNDEGNVICDGVTLEIATKGKKPVSGTIKYEEGKVIYLRLVFGTNDPKVIVMDNKGELVLGGNICTLIEGEPNEIGSKYECEVKPGTKYNFYVLSKEEDESANLIMERNICEDGTVATEEKKCTVAWNSSGVASNGPVTALTYLNNATKNWNNISNITIDYTDENVFYETIGYDEVVPCGYEGIKTINTTTVITNKQGIETIRFENLKARLPKFMEITYKCNFGEIEEVRSGCPSWLVSYLNKNENKQGETLPRISGIHGFWILSSHSQAYYESNFVWYIGVSNLYADTPGTANYYGIRPVINVKL